MIDNTLPGKNTIYSYFRTFKEYDIDNFFRIIITSVDI